MMNNHALVGAWISCPYYITTPCAAFLNLEVVEVLSNIPGNFSVFPGCRSSMENSSRFQSSYLVTPPKRARRDSQYRIVIRLKLLKTVVLWQFL